MEVDVWVVMTWVLFLALFPLAFAMLRRAWKIGVKRDFTLVSAWNGQPVPNPERWAHAFLVLNFLAGGALVAVIGLVLGGFVTFTVWASLVALVVWFYYFTVNLVVRKARRLAGEG